MSATIASALTLSRRELLVLVAAFALSLPAVTPRIYASDEIQYFSYLRSLWFDRDVSFENEYQHFYEQNIGRGEGFHATFLEAYTEAGRRPSFATIGCALLWMPFYAAGHAVAIARGYPTDGFSHPYIAAVAYGSAFYAFAAVLLSISAARRVVGHGLAAGVIVWIGTPLLFYAYVSPPYSHACSAFAVALFVTVWLRGRESWTPAGAVALGLTGALMAMVREQDVILLIGPAVDFFVTVVVHRDGSGCINQRSRGPTPARTSLAPSRSAAATGAAESTSGLDPRQPGSPAFSRALLIAGAGLMAFLTGSLPQLLAYKALNGHYGPSRLVVRKMSWSAPHAWEVLASPQHGFLLWTPLAAIALAGLVMLALRSDSPARRVAGCALLMVAAQIYVSGSVESWTVAGAFGQRRFVALTILLTIGLAAVLAVARRTPWRAPVAIAIAIAVWWNLALIAQFGTGMMNRQRLELGKNAYDAFITIPALAPDLAGRYLFDRGSFYGREQRRSP
ncbi:MAG TPA: hypothetical protein VFJ02_09360 [Vicinamibacterales bacterium]|nr:hypothetical protein [Vicinamibacterales bacterium]